MQSSTLNEKHNFYQSNNFVWATSNNKITTEINNLSTENNPTASSQVPRGTFRNTETGEIFDYVDNLRPKIINDLTSLFIHKKNDF